MAIFGKDNSDLLHQILRELGELRERVTSQQQAIDQIRHDTTAAITAGLAEIRAVARDGLARTNEIITGPVASIGHELVTIRGAIGQLDNQLRTASTAASTPAVAEPEREPAEDTRPEPAALAETSQQKTRADTELLQAAAGISHAELHMHRDTWAFLVEHAAGDKHFHIPGKVDDHDGAVTVHVSGPSIVAALTSLSDVSQAAGEPGTRAIAGHIHGRLVETVQDIVTRPHRGDGAEAVRIIIDDRAKPDNEE